MKVSIELDVGELVRVSGPAKLRVAKGKVIVLGAVLMPENEVVIHSTRSYAVKCVDGCGIEVDIGDGAAIEKPQVDEEPLDSWISKVDELLDSGCKSFIVVGPVDAGKTSVAALIANRIVYRGAKVAVVDADVGQADIGPPACVSAATVDKYVFWLRELYAEKLRFIGSIVPQRFEKRIVGAVVDLVWEYRKEGIDYVVVDTDGWVSGSSALEYKAEMARYADIDAAICVGCEGILVDMFKSYFSALRCGAHLLASPKVKRTRDRDVRRLLRSEAYKRYLGQLHERVVELKTTPVLGSCLFSGRLFDAEELKELSAILGVRVVAASETNDAINIVADQYPRQQAIDELVAKKAKHVYIHIVGDEANVLAGIIGPSGKEEAIGIVKEIDYTNMRMKIVTPYQGEIKGVILGVIKLSDDMVESGRVQRCAI